MKSLLLSRLVIASGLAVLCMAIRPPRAAAQVEARQDSPGNGAVYVDPPAVSRASFAPLMSIEPDARLHRTWRDASVPAVQGNNVDVRLLDAPHAPEGAGHGSRGKHVLIGALVGGVAGGVAKFAFPAKCIGPNYDMCGLGEPIELAADVGLGVLVGGVIGALLPAGQ